MHICTSVQNHTVALQQLIYKFHDKFLRMKIKRLDKKGNIILGTTAILIVSLLLICIFVVTAITFRTAILTVRQMTTSNILLMIIQIILKFWEENQLHKQHREFTTVLESATVKIKS